MAARDLLATAPPQGGDVPAWSWYVPLILMAVLIAAFLTYLYFTKKLLPLVLESATTRAEGATTRVTESVTHVKGCP